MRVGLVLAALVVSHGIVAAEVDAATAYQLCEISLSAFPPTRTRVHVVAKNGCVSQTFEWDPDVPTSLLRSVVWPSVVWPKKAKCSVRMSADHSFVSAGTAKLDIAWSLDTANTANRELDANNSLSIRSGRPSTQTTEVVAELMLNCPNQHPLTSFGVASAGLGDTVAATGRSWGAPGGDVVTDVAWAATSAALSRLERRALERVRRHIEDILACEPVSAEPAKAPPSPPAKAPPSPPAKAPPSPPFSETCHVIRSLRLSQLESVAAALVRALRDDAAKIALCEAMGQSPGCTGEPASPELVLVQRLITLSLADSRDAHAYASALADYATQAPEGPVKSAILAADWCLGLLTCNEGMLSSRIGRAFMPFGDSAVGGLFRQLTAWIRAPQGGVPHATSDTEWVGLARRIVALMRALQSGPPGKQGAAARALLTDPAWLKHAMGVSGEEKTKRVQLLLEVTGPDWLRAVPEMCEMVHHVLPAKCTHVLGPLIASLGPIAEAAAISASTHQEREARREAIATAIERVAELQTDRKERDNDWIVSAAVTFDLGYQMTDEAGGLRFGATLGVALDGPKCSAECPIWFHAMLGIIDTTQILTAEVQAARQSPPAAEDGSMEPAEGEMTAATEDDAELSDNAEWESLFYPSLRAGLGLYSREFPILVTAGFGVGRVEEEERVRARPMLLLGLSIGVPLIDLN